MKPDLPLLLAGRVALVTGATSGIGRAIAIGLARAGAQVAVNHLNQEDRAREVVSAITAAGGRALAVHADIGRSADHAPMLAAIHAEFGAVEILVNNAGIETRADVLAFTSADWDAQVDVNLKGPFFLTQEVARRMIGAGLKGRILNVSSTHETRPLRRAAIYNITKGGLAMLTRSFALELAPHGICVNSLIPGAIRTEMTRAVLADPLYETKVVAAIPLGRIGEPTDLVEAAVFLAGPGAAYMTGASLTLDGGLSL